jgi:hypothetical protein
LPAIKSGAPEAAVLVIDEENRNLRQKTPHGRESAQEEPCQARCRHTKFGSFSHHLPPAALGLRGSAEKVVKQEILQSRICLDGPLDFAEEGAADNTSTVGAIPLSLGPLSLHCR